jgi:hypothetical protein
VDMGLGSLYVVGGRQRSGFGITDRVNRDWYEYDRGVIVEVEPLSGHASCVGEYVSAPGSYAESNPQITFKSGWAHCGLLYCVTMTEVVVFKIPEFGSPVKRISLPCFNDLHFVRQVQSGDNLVVANSGLDNCIELTSSGEIVSIFPMLEEDPWDRFDPRTDYRMISTKPHRSHPNNLFYIGDELWVTRFEQKDAISIKDRTRRINIAEERPHDGVVFDGILYFSTVDGRIFKIDPDSLQITDVIDLKRFGGKEGFDSRGGEILGWTRGIYHVTSDLVWVGFTRLRPTRFRSNVQFLANGFVHPKPTRIALYDLSAGRLLKEINLEEAGLDAVFSIIPVPARHA